MLTLQPVCTGGYHAELHTDAVVKQCEIVDVIEIIGSKKMTPYERPLYLKNGDVVLCRIRVWLHLTIYINYY